MMLQRVLLGVLASCLLALPASGEDVFVQTTNGPFKMYVQSHALLIGNSDYETGWDDLDAVPTDIGLVAEELEKQGFVVETKSNLTTDAIGNAIRSFLSRDYPRDTRLFIYYAGHGWSEPDGTMGYIVPVNAPRAADESFRGTLVSMQDIRAAMERPRAAKHVLFVFDSCFSGTIFTTKGTDEPDEAIISSIDQPGRQFITSGSAGQRVPAASLFAPALVLGMGGAADLTKDGIVTGSELGIWLKTELGSNALTPQWGSMPLPYNVGDFVFRVASLNLPLPIDATRVRPPPLEVVTPKKSEVVPVDSNLAAVASGGVNPCGTQVAQVCVRPKSGGRLLPETAQFMIETYAGNVISEGGTEDKSPVSNIGWWIPPNPTPEKQFCVRVYARTSACESEVSISGRLTVFEEFDGSIAAGEVSSTPRFPSIVYFRHDLDERRVLDVLDGHKYPYEGRAGDSGVATNALTCTPDVPIEFVKELATDLLNAGVGLKTIHEARLDPMPSSRISLEANTAVEEWPPLTVSRISRLTECPQFGELRPDLITVTNTCAEKAPINVGLRVLDAVTGSWVTTVVPNLGFNKTQVVRGDAGLGAPLQTDHDVIIGWATPTEAIIDQTGEFEYRTKDIRLSCEAIG